MTFVYHKIYATGTVKLNRSGIPKCLLNVHEWARKHERGDVRWIRHCPVLALQWVDCKPVTILPTLFSANEETTCESSLSLFTIIINT